MLFNIIMTVAVLAITFMHSIFGVFSGLINVFCSFVALCAALGFYEPLNFWMTDALGLHPAYSEPVAIFLLYFGVQIGLRQVFDQYVRGNVHVPQGLDVTGSVICGFVNAQIAIGVLVICTAMMPIGAENVFERYKRTNDKTQQNVTVWERNSLWLRSDEMTVWLFKTLSAGSMSSNTNFASVYPNFVDNIYYTTNVVQPESMPAPPRDKKSGDGFKNGMKLETWWEQKEPLAALYRQEVPTLKNRQPKLETINYKPESGMKLIGARLMLNKSSADRSNSSIMHVFRPTQIRVVGVEDDTPTNYVARVIGGADTFSGGKYRLCDYDTNFALPGDADRPIDVFFEVPTNFKPKFVEYRRHARVAMGGEPAVAGPAQQIALGPAGEVGGGASTGSESSGKLAFGNVVDSGTNEVRNMPFDMSLDALKRIADVKLDGEELVHGRFAGPKSRLGSVQGAKSVNYIKVPAGKKLFQMRYEPKKVNSLVGQVFNFVGGNINQYFALDDRGGRYPLAGYFAVVKRGKEDYVEFFFNGPDTDDKLDPSYKYMLDFKEVTKAEVNDTDGTFVGLIFIVDPGVRITRVENQGHDGGDLNIPISP